MTAEQYWRNTFVTGGAGYFSLFLADAPWYAYFPLFIGCLPAIFLFINVIKSKDDSLSG